MVFEVPEEGSWMGPPAWAPKTFQNTGFFKKKSQGFEQGSKLWFLRSRKGEFWEGPQPGPQNLPNHRFFQLAMGRN